MALSEADTRAKLIDPALHPRGWTRDLIELEESAEAGASSLVKYRTNQRVYGDKLWIFKRVPHIREMISTSYILGIQSLRLELGIGLLVMFGLMMN